jgi:hypothetical protein
MMLSIFLLVFEHGRRNRGDGVVGERRRPQALQRTGLIHERAPSTGTMTPTECSMSLVGHDPLKVGIDRLGEGGS